MYVHHASHLISKIQYVHTLNLETDVRFFCTWYEGEYGVAKMAYIPPAEHKCPSNIFDVRCAISIQKSAGLRENTPKPTP